MTSTHNYVTGRNISKIFFTLLQLHFVSYNTKYANIAEAIDKPDGLAVLGLLIEVRIDFDAEDDDGYSFPFNDIKLVHKRA